MAAEKCPAGQLATGTDCLFVWKPVKSHMCCSQMWPQHQHFPSGRFCHGVTCQILSRELRPLGQLIRALRLWAELSHPLQRRSGWGESRRAGAWCVCVCLSCIEALSPCSLYLWCFTRWETKGLCVFFKVLCADCDTHPGKTQPKAVTLPLVQTPNATYSG